MAKYHKRTSGFIYIWRDRRKNMFYIGSHWGDENDGYICSSAWMRNTYKRHSKDFKRRILKRIIGSYKDVLIEEKKWLSFIKESELGVKYYNRTRNVSTLGGDGISEETRQKQRAAKLGKSNKHKGKTLEELHGTEKAATIRVKLRESHLGQEAWNKGKEYTQIQGDNHWKRKYKNRLEV
jgi:hypothetical protein